MTTSSTLVCTQRLGEYLKHVGQIGCIFVQEHVTRSFELTAGGITAATLLVLCERSLDNIR